MERIYFLMKIHFTKNIVLYGIVLFIFLVGITSGAFTINAISPSQRKGLADYMDGFIGNINEGSRLNIDRLSIFFEGVRQYCGFAFGVWVLGISYIGMPFIAFILGTRGFLLGFTTGFFISTYGAKGALFIVLCILPQNLIYIPCIIIITVIGLNSGIWAYTNRKMPLAKRLKNKEFMLYTKSIFLIAIILLLGIIYETIITSFIMDYFLRIL